MASSLYAAQAVASIPCHNGAAYATGAFWVSNSAPIRLTYSGNTFCYLSGVAGQFHGGGEKVEVVVGGDGYWYLQGSALSTGVEAQANCLAGMASQEATWSQQAGHQNNQLIDIGPTGQTHCYLTRMSGHFQGGGESIKVVDQWSGGVLHHYITGTAGAAGLAIKGSARCSGQTSTNSYISVNQGLNPNFAIAGGLAYSYIGNQYYCNYDTYQGNPNALTSVHGKFEGTGEMVWVVLNDRPWNDTCGNSGTSCAWNYYLAVWSQQAGVGGSVAQMY